MLSKLLVSRSQLTHGALTYLTSAILTRNVRFNVSTAKNLEPASCARGANTEQFSQVDDVESVITTTVCN